MTIIDIKLPEYKTTLPISKEVCTFRPFTVKEEKILLLAQEEGSIENILTSINQIFKNCTGGKYTITNLNKIDAEWLFVQIKNKSMGEDININAICEHCGAKTPLVLDTSKITVTNQDNKMFEPIELSPNIWITMKIPTIEESLKVTDGVTAFASVLDSIIVGDESKSASDYTFEERVELVESFSSATLRKLDEFLNKFPNLIYTTSYKCNKCENTNTFTIEGIENFFE